MATSFKNILLVEDDRISAYYSMRVLRKFGFSVIEDIITCGEDIPEAARIYKPDLILLDLNLSCAVGGIDGILKLNASLIASGEDLIPVIILTSSIAEGVFEQAKKISPYGFIFKPLRGEDAVSVVYSAFQRFELEKLLKEHKASCERLFGLLDSIVYKSDIYGNIISVSHNVKELFGVNHIDLVGKNILEFIDTESTRNCIVSHQSAELDVVNNTELKLPVGRTHVQCIHKFVKFMFNDKTFIQGIIKIGNAE